MTYTADSLHAEGERGRARMARYLTTTDVSELLRTPAETVRYWRHVGRGPKSFKLPGARRVLYALEDVEAFIAEARSGGDAA